MSRSSEVVRRLLRRAGGVERPGLRMGALWEENIFNYPSKNIANTETHLSKDSSFDEPSSLLLERLPSPTMYLMGLRLGFPGGLPTVDSALVSSVSSEDESGVEGGSSSRSREGGGDLIA